MNLEELIHKRLSEAKTSPNTLHGTPGSLLSSLLKHRETGNPDGAAPRSTRGLCSILICRPMGSARALALFLWP